ncbi:hypothetical protein AGMMS49925_11060 [Deltaproteobacteria bacterium]|nr:hypothetical protein AGMMS49925_11060 [Deltaproteobacteria bacterium]
MGTKPSLAVSRAPPVYDGETLHIFAKFSKKSEYVPELTWKSDGNKGIAKPETLSQSTNKDIARLGGAKQMLIAGTTQEAVALALKYQLVSRHSNLFLFSCP